MSKRPVSSTSHSAPRKRRNARTLPPNDQPSLDSFFKTRPSPASPSGSPVASSSRAQAIVTTAAPASRLAADLDDDEAFARRLAEEDGLDVDILRDLEIGFSSSAAAVAKSNSIGPKQEVIDVDLLDDTYQVHRVEVKSQTAQIGTTDKEPTESAPSSPTKSTPKLVGSEPAAVTIEYPSLSADPLGFPLDRCPWQATAAAPYSFLAHVLSTLSGTRSRIAIMNTLTNALRIIVHYHPSSLCPALYLLSNSLSPPYSPLELGLGPSIISKAIQDVSGLTSAALKRLYNRTGDAGIMSHHR
jgi:DNA ligase 1